VLQEIRMNVHGPGGGYVVRGQIGGVSGKSGALTTTRSLSDKSLGTTLISIGRDDPTTAEAQRSATVLRILQGTTELLQDSPWIKNIWFPGDDLHLTWPKDWSLPILSLANNPPPPHSSSPPDVVIQLNPSQQDAVNTMYSSEDAHRITIVQGPPGTGKTSVIAAYVQLAVEDGSDGLWLVAQSNVAVKNIAEKLMKVGFLDWKLLVSKDFHFEWYVFFSSKLRSLFFILFTRHEHIYTKIEDNVIRSNRFRNISTHEIKGCKVMLCTLSMLSNHNLKKFTSLNPIKTLIVDEASQIEIGDYVSVFSDFHTTLRKACFIGDDKQCRSLQSTPSTIKF
jgi:hypothetical protein